MQNMNNKIGKTKQTNFSKFIVWVKSFILTTIVTSF